MKIDLLELNDHTGSNGLANISNQKTNLINAAIQLC